MSIIYTFSHPVFEEALLFLSTLERTHCISNAVRAL